MNNTTYFTTDMDNGLFNVTTPRVVRPRPPQPPIGYYGDARVMMLKVLPPIIISWGTIGNLLTIILLFRQMKRLSSTAMYLMTLAVTDTMILWCGPFRNWVKQIWDIDVRYLSEASCKSQIYLTYVSIHMSSWLLVAVTLERVLSVLLPHKVKLGCTLRNAGLVISGTFILICGLDSVLPVINGLKGYDNFNCSPTTKEYKDFRDDVFEWIDFCVAFAAPLLILLTSNILIIVTLYRSRSNQKEMTVACGQKSSGRDTASISRMLIALCVIFFLTMAPVTIFQVYYPYRAAEVFKLKNPYERWYAYQYLLFQHTVVNMIGYTNALFNFVLYVFSGSKFRGELKALFRCRSATLSGVFGSRSSKPSSSGKTKSSTMQSATSSKVTTATNKTIHINKPINGVANGSYGERQLHEALPSYTEIKDECNTLNDENVVLNKVHDLPNINEILDADKDLAAVNVVEEDVGETCGMSGVYTVCNIASEDVNMYPIVDRM